MRYIPRTTQKRIDPPFSVSTYSVSVTRRECQRQTKRFEKGFRRDQPFFLTPRPSSSLETRHSYSAVRYPLYPLLWRHRPSLLLWMHVYRTLFFLLCCADIGPCCCGDIDLQKSVRGTSMNNSAVSTVLKSTPPSPTPPLPQPTHPPPPTKKIIKDALLCTNSVTDKLHEAHT